MTWHKIRPILILAVIIGLTLLLWDELRGFGAELYRFFN